MMLHPESAGTLGERIELAKGVIVHFSHVNTVQYRHVASLEGVQWFLGRPMDAVIILIPIYLFIIIGIIFLIYYFNYHYY